jgi:hypothetical protein
VKNYLILLLISLVLNSCNFNKFYKNREIDKIEAEHITKEYYTLISKNKKIEAELLFSELFFKKTSRKQLNQIYYDINKYCGNVVKIDLKNWETLVSVGTNPDAKYVLIYNVNRGIKNTQEKISLRKEGTIIRITGYDISLAK